jgi:hypothetical protein
MQNYIVIICYLRTKEKNMRVNSFHGLLGTVIAEIILGKGKLLSENGMKKWMQ